VRNTELTERWRTLIYVATTFLVQFGSFLVIPLFWRKLSPADYGVIAVTEIVGIVLAVVGSLSLEQAINRFYYQWPAAERRAKTGTIWALSWTFIVANCLVALWLFSHASPVLFPSIAFRPYILLGIIGSALSSLTAVCSITVRIERRAVLYLIWSLLVFVIRIGTSAYLVIVLNRGLLGYLWGNVLSGILLAGASIPLMLAFAAPSLAVRNVLPEIKYVLPIIPAVLLQSFATVADRYVLQMFASVETLGIYAVSLKFCGLITGLHEALKLSYGPRLMKLVAEDQEEAKQFITSVVPRYVLPLFAMAGAVSVLIRPFVLQVGRREYESVVDVVPPLMLASVIGVLNIYYSPGMLIAKRTSLLVVPSAVALVTNVLGGALLTNYFQLPGLLCSRFVGGISLFLTNLWLSQRVFPLRHKWNSLFLAVGGTTAVGLAAAALPSAGRLGAEVGPWLLLGAGGLFVWSLYRRIRDSADILPQEWPAYRRDRERPKARSCDSEE
jgi:O-antigen/teichoic acid export membrane protein